MSYNVSFISLGCAKNQVNCEQMMALCSEAGYAIQAQPEDCDVVVVNTCGFLASACEEAIENILEMAELKKAGQVKKILVTGCMSQRYKDEVKREIPEIDIIIGTNEYDKIAEYIAKYTGGDASEIHCSEEYMGCEPKARTVTTPPYMAYLKIAEGCDNHCTYCVIPSIRGRYRSRSMEDIAAEAERLAADGAKELIVIAQDTTRYGIDLYGEYKLPELLKRLCRIDGVHWIRLHYCYPELVTDELIDTVAAEEKICSYFDIPIQHCNDKILKLMGRKTNKAQITELVEKLRKRIPDVVIRTSLIAGFPTETAEQFDELREFVTDTAFDRLGVFAYSREEGTPAAAMDGQIDEEEKKNRQEIIMVDQSAVSEELNEKRVGTVYEVLTEGYDPIIKQYYGRTYADSDEIDGKVFFTSKTKIAPGSFVNVRISDYMEYDLYGAVEE